ncbi:MAG: cellulase family glycosylhydrolase, partial [Lachnospiraceae bacterium]|nr:cellulase family glycosylhydrolase [Lachnospiraceae bacterium]
MKGGAKEGTAVTDLQLASDTEGADVTVVAENTDGQQEPQATVSETVEQSAAGMAVGGDSTGTVTSNAMPNANDVASAATNTGASSTANAVNTATTTTTTAAPAGASSAKGYVLTYGTNNSWQKGDVTMFGVDFQITNNSAAQVEGWTLTMEISGLAEVDGWNGTFKASGNTLTITNADYNGAIGNGGSVNCGCNLGVKASNVTVTGATLNGTACTVVAGVVDPNAQANAQNAQNNNQNNNNQNNNNNNNNNQQAPVDVSAMLTRCADAVQGDDWLHTDGHRILDKNGKEVWLTGVNWFGYNTGTNTFDGLWNSQMAPTVKAIADHGFNLIRVPISAQLLNDWAAGNYPKANYNNAYNTELNSMNSLQIFDYFLSLAEANGLKVMIDIHSAETDAMGHNANMWCTQKVTADQYLAALAWCADRYKNNDTIIAYDLKNEPHGKPNEGKNAAIWNGSKDANNWK